jgi:transcriptional regulator
MSTKAEQLEWRRGKVIELRTRGLSYAEIASELQVTKTAVAEDMLYLRKRAKESIKEYVTEHLPEQYQIALRALDTILKHAYEILQEAYDNREKIQALELFKDTHLVKLELLSNATTIDHALEYIRNKQQTQQHQKKGQDLDSTNEDEGHYSSSRTMPGTTTTTGKQSVF